MFLTQEEILDTPSALGRTYQYFTEQDKAVTAFFTTHRQRKFVFVGCGSSHMLAKSAAALFASFPSTAATALPAGDYLVDPAFWAEAVRGSIVVVLSRSGRTSEIVRAAQHMKDKFSCPIVSICMQTANDMAPISDFALTLDWCYDNSVCQTRTVTNLYAATLLLGSAYAEDEALRDSVHTACYTNASFQQSNMPVLETVAKQPWDNIVVLADGPLCGIAEEGALAFTEIAMLTGRYFHMLDYRHGPIVISGENTLTIMVLRPSEGTLQEAMVRDVIAGGGTVITVSQQEAKPSGAAAHIQISDIADFAAWGIPFIFISQMTALLKSVNEGGNPDAPKGLSAYITLH